MTKIKLAEQDPSNKNGARAVRNHCPGCGTQITYQGKTSPT
jgi:hypothetical protein